MDETYQTYVNRVARLTIPDVYQTQLQNIQKSPKFQSGKFVAFPGYTVLTPLYTEDSLNGEFYFHLKTIQQQLSEQIESDMIAWVPPNSFHLTLADLIWDKSYQEAVQDRPNFDQKIKVYIEESFKNYQKVELETNETKWQLLGLLVFPRALVAGLVPCDELSYKKIVQLRRSIYQNMDLIALGIEQQYHFTAHISLGYFTENIYELDRDYLASVLTTFDDKWLEAEPKVLTISQVELRKFEDMTNFLPRDDNPKVEL
ncbi:MAG: DUF1868 domain-containing protein [cyanobacterium endosymbiont of Rhopalodia musculus]|uniref:DUF1868 domain-containing protein n=1 Tax=cyanobacterium endosymbiont of Epithemia clementina EcSB TaxID=3034674 RepID=UPI0024817039|nr:DUF1868 domain-containing protein [cyanobacterium endosymbiont of Epithemia clementina EcSB]WGT68139.1 DUF1868 domain-containing protein [cyanobacterium endosymbiont of Epithemia clementina EcSB]